MCSGKARLVNVASIPVDAMSGSKESPYLSIVITSRNDDHGGDMLQRMQISLGSLLEQLEKHRIESELILIDWNPPADKPLLKDVLKWPDKLRYCTIRVIVVPLSIHQRYQYSDKIPMNAVVAVNSGIRRSRGLFVLPGVIDLLYSDELMSYIASKSLKNDERIRVNRCDVNRNVVQCNTPNEQLAFCKHNIIQIHSYSPSDAESDFPKLHTNACGDFQLMSRHYWHLLRGYREGDIVAAHVDGLLSYASYAAGVKEVILSDPARIYHIDHDHKFHERLKMRRPRFEEWVSSPFMPSRVGKRLIALYRKFMGDRTRAEVYGIATLSHAEYMKICKELIAGKRAYIFNNETWGLGEENVPESVISVAEWEDKATKCRFHG